MLSVTSIAIAIGTDENLLQAKLAETLLMFSKFCYSSTNTFEINISAEPERKESLRLAFPISLHLLLALDVRIVFALLSLFPYI